MENEVINCLAKEIVKKFEDKLDIKGEMEEFLKTSLSIESKEKALEQIYLCQLYSGAYVGPDPRGTRHLLGNVYRVLNVKTEEELEVEISNLEKAVEFFKNAAIHPIATTKKKLEDRERYRGVIF